eukprot:CAMPEP_0203768788 /NCGR_PEP_ID=MMETSP0099_2-20121227/1802_1 /ASSEMBLY_ACC=CAM_ASM_000209 /TAXON_ID=96639 /ORGANISM=" , Strain NY0313808BC1" /LENGTH=357 /DNA_ID=CAMNT_0050665557 /DNA_START=71 /DNA_END=1144 /DNA_ORIENTATION=-
MAPRVHFGHKGRIFWCCMKPDDQTIIATACEDGTIALWDDSGGADESCKKSFQAHDDEALRVCWDKEFENVLYSGGADGKIKVFKVGDDFEISPQSSIDVAQGSQEGQIYSILQFDKQLEIGAAHDDSVTIMDKSRLDPLLSWKYHPTNDKISVGGPRNPENKSFVFDASTLESVVYAALSDGTIRSRDVRSPLRDINCVPAHSNYTTSCGVADNFLASGSGDGTCSIWDIRTWKCLHTYNTQRHAIYGIDFWPSNPSLMYSWSGNGQVTFHQQGQVVCALSAGNARKSLPHYPVYSTCMRSDGSQLVMAGGASLEPTMEETFGMLPYPIEEQGCVRYTEKDKVNLIPWISISMKNI